MYLLFCNLFVFRPEAFWCNQRWKMTRTHKKITITCTVQTNLYTHTPAASSVLCYSHIILYDSTKISICILSTMFTSFIIWFISCFVEPMQLVYMLMFHLRTSVWMDSIFVLTEIFRPVLLNPPNVFIF